MAATTAQPAAPQKIAWTSPIPTSFSLSRYASHAFSVPAHVVQRGHVR